jgi:hypothetical protein
MPFALVQQCHGKALRIVDGAAREVTRPYFLRAKLGDAGPGFASGVLAVLTAMRFCKIWMENVDILRRSSPMMRGAARTP